MHSSPAQKNRRGVPKKNGWMSMTSLIPPPPLNMCFALDCEMVGIGPDGRDSTIARVAVVNSDLEVVLDTFVRPAVPVTDFRTFISGVRPHDIESEKAMTLKECRLAIRSILRGKILIGHGLENDLRALGVTHPWSDVRDTAAYGPFMRVQNFVDRNDNVEQCIFIPRKLRDLAWEELGLQIQVMGKAHCPKEDAIAAMELYKMVRLEWEGLIVEQRRAAAEMEHRHMLMTNSSFMQKVAAHQTRQSSSGQAGGCPKSTANSKNKKVRAKADENIAKNKSEIHAGCAPPGVDPPSPCAPVSS